MKALFAILVLLSCGLAAAKPLAEEDDFALLQGVWHGTGQAAPFTLVFCGDALIGIVGEHPLLDAQTSRYRAAYGGIDIDREEGVQLGIYRVEGDVLTLMLADVGTPRPLSLDVPNVERAGTTDLTGRPIRLPRTQRRYMFERQR
jgi:hypothetical protein